MSNVWGGLDALGMEVGETRVVDEGSVTRLSASDWQIDILGHKQNVGAQIASNVLADGWEREEA